MVVNQWESRSALIGGVYGGIGSWIDRKCRDSAVFVCEVLFFWLKSRFIVVKANLFN